LAGIALGFGRFVIAWRVAARMADIISGYTGSVEIT